MRLVGQVGTVAPTALDAADNDNGNVAPVGRREPRARSASSVDWSAAFEAGLGFARAGHFGTERERARIFATTLRVDGWS